MKYVVIKKKRWKQAKEAEERYAELEQELDRTHHQLVVARQKICDLEAMLRHERLEKGISPMISLSTPVEVK